MKAETKVRYYVITNTGRTYYRTKQAAVHACTQQHKAGEAYSAFVCAERVLTRYGKQRSALRRS